MITLAPDEHSRPADGREAKQLPGAPPPRPVLDSGPYCQTHEPDPEYSDVGTMFEQLARLPAESTQYLRQRDRIIERCLPLAEHIARRYRNRGEPLEDLRQVALVGLVKAVHRFDVQAGFDFLSFAVPTMMGEVKRYFRDFGWSVGVPRGLKDIYQQLIRATAELSQHLGRAPTVSELANELDMDRADVVQGVIASRCYWTSSLDAPARDAEDPIAAVAEQVGEHDSGFDSVENREALRPLLAALPNRERDILYMRFIENQTQSRIAERLGISQMHVSRLLARTLVALREGLAD